MLKKFVFTALAVSSLAFTYDSRYVFDQEETRKQLFALIENHVPTEMVIIDPPEPGSKQAQFLAFYEQNILPVINELSEIGLIYSVHDQLIDAGLYKTDEEKLEWQAQKDAAYTRYIAYTVDPKWEQVQLRLGELAEGLDGEMARVSRMDAAALRFSQFAPEQQDLIKEQQKLYDEVDEISNTSPFMVKYQENRALNSQVLADYFAGKIGFEQASEQVEKLSLEGAYAYGKDTFTRGASQLNRIAEIRSILAKSKGFETHAELKVAAQSVAHAEEFKTKEQLLSFLESLLAQTQEVNDRYTALMAKQAGIKDPSQLRPFQSSLLGQPTYLLMRDYYQKERFDDLWLGTMRESGFPQGILDQIIVDSFPRENKNSHAYMKPIRTPVPETLKIDGTSLNPQELPESEWLPSAIYILQNYSDDGLGGLSTAFHEGGHALDYAYQHDELGFPAAYGYVETHSTTMESFIEDREFLLAHGATRTGERITAETVDLFIKRKSISDLLSFRSNVENAIFDIRLWDYDYETGPLTFTERATQLADEMHAKYSSYPWPQEIEAKPVHANFITSHYRSGSVRYFGYVLAEVSAALMSEALLDRLEQQTGRRSLYQQANIAAMLGEGIYREGFKPAFPESVEEFTGKDFSPDNFTTDMIERVSDFLDEIEGKGAGGKK